MDSKTAEPEQPAEEPLETVEEVVIPGAPNPEGDAAEDEASKDEADGDEATGG